jgi:hypothetical protein
MNEETDNRKPEAERQFAPVSVRPTVYAYGVKPLYGGPNGEHFQELPDGKILLWKPHAFLHYWIDEGLNYHECVNEIGEMPGCLWVTRGKFKVELYGPNNYTVKSAYRPSSAT